MQDLAVRKAQEYDRTAECARITGFKEDRAGYFALQFK
jgi:hypothetical protein